ncbi:MAG: asparagine synthase (glutamine-hydrolyzing) [Acidobacteria bacterium]|nr:MAG: asparagine synthase (glutamine-hydrolyzing) [Acidobacteriota bacterium]
MCGIAGWATPSPIDGASERMAAMLASMEHRGPDDQGVALMRGPAGAEIALGMRRLSIIDIEGGHQPIASEDGRITVVCNGEIYNCGELRRALEARGHSFRSRSDVEVIAHLYEDLGTDAISRLRGMFAVAIFDGERLVLARDRLGIKPLYLLRRQDCGIEFASEAKALTAVQRVSAEADSISTFLAWGYLPAPLSPFESIEKLPAGHMAIWSAGGLEVKRWWTLDFDAAPSSSPEDETLAALDEAVREHLMSDVPLGVFLSGGIDSSVVAALMARSSEQPIRTFTVGFSPAAGELDERENALEVARSLGAEHTEIVVDAAPVEIAGSVARAYDEPVGDEAAFPTWLIGKAAREHVKVVLTGEGGDEVFGGYRKYQMILAAKRIAGSPGSLRGTGIKAIAAMAGEHRAAKIASIINAGAAEASLHFDEIFLPAERSAVLARDLDLSPAEPLLAPEHGHPDALGEMLAIDTAGYLADGLLHKVDRMTMAHGLEARVPFLDHKLVELLARFPQHEKVRLGAGKRILRSIAADLLPPEVHRRKKHGFTVPLNRWLREDLAELVAELLAAERIRTQGYWNPSGIGEVVKAHRDGDDSLGRRIWLLLAWQMWHEAFIEREQTSS